VNTSILRRFDLTGLIEEVRETNAKKIGIQLPDGIKYWIFEIVRILEKEGFEVVVSGKASYGSCDIDLELLKKVDLLMHFSHTPVIELDRVVYVPYKVEYNVESVLKTLRTEDIEFERVSLTATSQYAHKLEEVKERLEDEGFKVYLKKGSDRVKMKGQVLGCNFTSVDRRAEAVIFVGDGNFHPKGIAIYSKKDVYAVSPLEEKLRKFRKDEVEKFIRERYTLIAKAMECKNFCVVASSKPGQNRLDLAVKLRNLLNSVNCNSIIVYTDEVRLENFPCECIINTACPRISYDDWRVIKKPVLTPQEAEIIAGKRSLDDYEVDEIL